MPRPRRSRAAAAPMPVNPGTRRQRTCPICHAHPGEPCYKTSKTGVRTPMTTLHAPR